MPRKKMTQKTMIKPLTPLHLRIRRMSPNRQKNKILKHLFPQNLRKLQRLMPLLRLKLKRPKLFQTLTKQLKNVKPQIQRLTQNLWLQLLKKLTNLTLKTLILKAHPNRLLNEIDLVRASFQLRQTILEKKRRYKVLVQMTMFIGGGAIKSISKRKVAG